MRNIFSQTKDYVTPPKRNAFDLSFHNHGTYNFGYLYPVFCKEVIPGDSFRINPSFALRFMPTAFPVQTRINANLHFFYVRNRNLWNDWQKFITHTGDSSVFPYISVGGPNKIATGELADYLGVPTTLVGSFGNYTNSDISSNFDDNGNAFYFVNSYPNFVPGITLGDLDYLYSDGSIAIRFPLSSQPVFNGIRVIFSSSSKYSRSFRLLFTKGLKVYGTIDLSDVPLTIDGDGNHVLQTNFVGCRANLISDPDNTVVLDKDSFLNFLSTNYTSDGQGIDNIYLIQSSFNSTIPETLSPPDVNRRVISFSLWNEIGDVQDLGDIPLSSNPFYQGNVGNKIRLSALPFRAYESIYNAFYRNEQNDPLIVNGEPEYNTYCPNTEGAGDSFSYKLHKRNWELDYLTSAVQTPQQGIAPLVGVSSQGNFTFVNKDSNGNIGYFTAKANISNDGSTITGFQLSNHVELDGLPSNPQEAGTVPDSVKTGTIYSLNQMALAGISINDFRNVNALQRWLETNIRRGYKYKDQIKSHFGVDVSYDVLDMPEFIGGVSSPVFSSQVNQTTETETDPLGSYAGQLSLMKESEHSIKHYCDEHGFIIGIFSVTPVPNYSQLLPKHFIKSNYLDYYFPEFGHIGMQPIDYREVCPIQAYGDSSGNLLKTFGYQRPWYDYISSVDEVHGLFRTNLRNFVLNRQFDSMPKLNADFLQIDPEQLNDIFTVQDLSDKIIGQIYFDVVAKRPIPKYGIPRLE